MPHRCQPWRLVCLACLLLLAGRAQAISPEPEGDPRYWDGYQLALRLLREGEWQKAADALTETEKIARGDKRLLLARGVARTLLADYENARDDLTRAQSRDTREPTLWLYAIAAMNDDLRIGGDIQPSGPPRRRGPGAPQNDGPQPGPFLGVPGHVVQGGKDYTTDYASHVIYEMAMPYRQALEARQRVNAEAFRKMQYIAGRWFANRVLASAEMAGRDYAWATKLMRDGSLSEARELLQLARTHYPLDADMAATAGDLWLAAGRPATARGEYTLALTMNEVLTGAYLGRSAASAAMGDARRAEADLAAAKALGTDTTAAAKRVEKLLAENPSSGDPQEILAAMDKASAQGATFEQLLPDALRLHRVMNAGRVRYDEVYQDTLRGFDAAIRADPKNVQAMLGLVEYLLDELDNRGENVEPRHGRVNYRAGDRNIELSRAKFYADKAMGLDSRGARPMLMEAMVLVEMGQEDAAARLTESATRASDGADPQAVRLLAQLRRRQVSRMVSAATALRTPTFSTTSWDEQRSDGVWHMTRTYRYDPSASDLARAAALEAEARRLMDATRATMEAAIKVSGGTVDGYLLESSYEDWFGTQARALTHLQTAVKEFPKVLRAHDALVSYLAHLGRREESLEAEAAGMQLVHTSCGALLRKAWLSVDDKGFGPLVDLLHRARRLDPADVRATIYLAEAERDLRNKEGAAALYSVAAALETARLQLDEQGEARAWPRRADDMATLMAAHNMLGKAAKLLKKDEPEIANYEATMALAKRFPPDGRKTPMFGAVFLQANAGRVPVVPTPNGAALAAEACLAAGNWYKEHDRAADAQRCFEMTAALGQPPRNDVFPGGRIARPRVGNSSGDSNDPGEAGTPSAQAMIELAKAKITRHDYRGAFDLLQQATQANPTPEMRQEINQLIMQIKSHLE